MKKLSLLLISLLASLMSWAQIDPNTGWVKANCFAYDLRVSYSTDMSQITLSYVLNADAIASGDTYKLLDKDGIRGVQLYVYDKNGNQVNHHYVPGPYVVKGEYKKATFNAADFTVGETYTWEVVVNGNECRTIPQLVASAAADRRPENAYGIACDHAMNRREFGQILVSRAKQVSDAYPYNTLLEYTPQLGYVGRHDKNIHNGNSGSYFAKNSPNYEPNRVKISEDGRVFVSSYHPTAAASVLEYLGANNYRTVINNDRALNAASNDTKNVLNRRTIGMDVMGKGDDLKIVVAWIDANGYNGNEAKVELYEYALGKANKAGFKLLDQIVGQNKTNPYVRKIAEYNCDKVIDAAAGGLLFQSFMNGGYSSIFGFVDVAYDQYGNVWMKIDYADKASCTPGKIVWFKNDGTERKEYSLTDNRTDGFYGGSAVLVNKDDVLFTGTGAGVIQAYDINEAGSLTKKEGWTVTDNTTGTTTRIGRWITGLAVDVVNNLHAVTEGVWSEGDTHFKANIVTIALPYSGQFKTTSPKISTFTRQNTTPIPNICATDLRYKYVEDRCVFSFKVNTKPKMAQIRFYDNKQGMINSVNTVHADNYSGNNKQRPSFVYNVPASQLKQGKIEVTLGMCSGKLSGSLDSEGCEIVNDSLPAGEWYWSVYVEAPRRSCTFAPIYTQPAVADPHRQHATVDNNPENDGFGHIYVADHHNVATAANRKHYVKAYTIANATGAGTTDNQNNINDNTRYGVSWQVKSNNKVHFTRRPVVSPDGMVYIADEGSNQKTAKPDWFKDPNTSTYGFLGAGLHVLDPSKQTNNDNAVWESNFSNPHGTTGNQEVTTGASFLYKDGAWKLYRTNTYDEFTLHPTSDGVDYNYQHDRWKTNGYRVYTLTSNANGLVHSGYKDNVSPTVKVQFGAGDANGQFSIVATKNGVWLCQHRANNVATAPVVDGNKQLPDNKENILLSFFDHSGARKFTSLTYDGGNLTQKETSPFQSAPGAGMAYQERNGVEYLYVINHNGYILEFKITGGNNPQLTLTQKYLLGKGTKGNHGAVSSMNFDYAGNLVVTAGQTYGTYAELQVGDPNVLIARDHQDLVIYTMPYPNRVNAQEIQAPNSCLFIPERLSQEGMNQDDVEPVVDPYIISPKNCTLDFYRTLQTGSFNSICLPFSLSSLSGTPYDGAEVMKFEKARLEEVGGEQHLYFDFVEVTSIEAGEPYLIQLNKDVKDVVHFGSVRFTKSQANTVNTGDYADFIGTFAQVNMDAPTTYPRFMVVSENCLAEIDGGTLLGFRSYFQMKKDITNTISLLNFKKPTTTDTEIVVDGQTVNVEKLIREGRVYIRAGETLYTITGEVVGR